MFVSANTEENEGFRTYMLQKLIVKYAILSLKKNLQGTKMEEEQEKFQRWYDKDPILKEALELLRLSQDNEKEQARDFILKLQEDVAADVIERIYEIVTNYEGKGNRWYDNDPVMIRAIEILRNADPKTQRKAALKLLLALEEKSFDA